MRIAEVADRGALERVYDEVLLPSFPASELMPPSWLTDGVVAGEVEALAGFDDGGAPLAAAVTERLTGDAELLTYLAALPASRGSGVGSALLRQVRDRATGRAALLLAEVERPDRHDGSPEHGDPTARLRFYERAGARVLDLPYVQPPIERGGVVVRGMLLLALHVSEDALREAGSAVDGSIVERAVAAMLGDQADDDGDLAALRAASSRSVVGLRPLAEWRAVPASS